MDSSVSSLVQRLRFRFWVCTDCFWGIARVIMRENGKLPSIALQEYLVYLKQGDRFDPESYLLRVTELIAGRERTCPLDEVSIDSKVDMDHPGVYEVTYQYTGEAGTGKTILTVVVE